MLRSSETASEGADVPGIQRGQPYQVAKGKWGVRYRDRSGKRVRSGVVASTKTGAFGHYRDVIAPTLVDGYRPPAEDHGAKTFSKLVGIYLERHAVDVRPRTIHTLTERLRHAEERFGQTPLRELAGMVDEIAAWQVKQPAGSRYGRVAALRQTLEAAVRWGYIDRNPAKATGRNHQPAPRPIRAFTYAELDAIAAELPAAYRPLPAFVAATGLRPEEWQAIERGDIDRRSGVLSVRRTVSSGVVVELGKTSRSRRQVPLSPRALAALDALPSRLDTPLVFPSPSGTIINTNNFASRHWRPAIATAHVATPARMYDLRSTFASNALAADVSAFELANIMGTSTAMIERHYGTLLEGATAGIASRLAAFEAQG
jgi:integrase